MIIGAILLAANLDACHVLTKREVAAVQGESFTAAKLTTLSGWFDTYRAPVP